MKLPLLYIKHLTSIFTSVPVKNEGAYYSALNISKLKPHADKIGDFQNLLISKHTNSDKIDQSHPKWNEFWADLNKFLQEEVEIDLKKINKNHIDFNSEIQLPFPLKDALLELINHGLLED